MKLKLPIPLYVDQIKYTEVEITKPIADVMFKTKKTIDSGDYFSGMKTFLEGCVVTVGNISDKDHIKRLLAEMPINSAEYLAMQIMLLEYPEDDGVEGIYRCPRCGTDKIAELKDEIDTRDFISDLNVNNYDGDNEITMDVEEVVITNKSTKEILLSVNSLSLRFPVFKDFIEAAHKVGYQNGVDIQKEVYIKCIIKVDGKEIDNKIRNKYGSKIIGKLSNKDLNKFGRKINEYGLDNKVDKVCNHCNKQWKATINTTNFFVSALPSN